MGLNILYKPTQFMSPFTYLVVGPSSCGKTVHVKEIIKHHNQMIYPAVENRKILWFYAAAQYDLEEELRPLGVEFKEGIPERSDFQTHTTHDGKKIKTLAVIDDSMCGKLTDIVKLVTVWSHHDEIDVIFIMQNVFHKGKDIRTITTNAHYITMFKNPRDKLQIKNLARQMYDRDSKVMEEAYTDATARPHGYLTIDLKQATPEQLRLRTNILPNEPPIAVYVNRKTVKGDVVPLAADWLK
jgi:hypothetical protein